MEHTYIDMHTSTCSVQTVCFPSPSSPCVTVVMGKAYFCLQLHMLILLFSSFLPLLVSMQDTDSSTQGCLVWLCGHLYDPGGEWSFPQHTRLPGKNNAHNTVYCSYTVFGLLTNVQQGVATGRLKETEYATNKHNYYRYVRL